MKFTLREKANHVPLLMDSFAQRSRAPVMTWLRGNHAGRTERWRYIRYRDGSEELYDRSSDPWEWVNLAGDSQYSSVFEEHQGWLPAVEAPQSWN